MGVWVYDSIGVIGMQKALKSLPYTHTPILILLVHVNIRILVLLPTAACALIVGCSGPSLQLQQFPDNGYAQTLNYQFQAQVHTDSEGRCKKMSVRVRPLNKVYWKEPPPERLQLFDDDCMSPVRFERIHYINNEGIVQLSGPEITQFWSSYFRLEDELVGWLWREGII